MLLKGENKIMVGKKRDKRNEKPKCGLFFKAKTIAKEIPWNDIAYIIAPCVGKIAAYAVTNAMYNGAVRFGCCSTNTRIIDTHGIARDNAVKALYGGGSLATGGRGIAGGEFVFSFVHSTIENAVPIAINTIVILKNSGIK